MISATKNFLRHNLKHYPLVLAYLSRLYNLRISFWRPLPGNLECILRRYFEREGIKISIIQIGSHDGITGDPLYSFVRTGNIPSILVEPVPMLYKKLEKLHKGYTNVICVNAAITASSGSIPFYVVDNNARKFPEYFDQLGSFDKEVILKQKKDFPEVCKFINAIDVVCMTLNDLAELLDIESCSLLHIDAEGYDLDILETVDFSRYGHDVILFEHVHVDICRYRKMLSRLKKEGYATRDCGTDTIAFRKKINTC